MNQHSHNFRIEDATTTHHKAAVVANQFNPLMNQGARVQSVTNFPQRQQMQRTLAKPVFMSGIGLHSGIKCSLKIFPAAVGHGIVFYRSDLATCHNDPKATVPARYDRVVDTSLCTVIGNGANAHESYAKVRTIEHLMAALAVLCIDNLLIEIDAIEVPIMDGSSAAFIQEFEAAGIATQSAPRRLLQVLRPIELHQGEKTISLKPIETKASHSDAQNNHSDRCEIDFFIEFKQFIGKQNYAFTLLGHGLSLPDFKDNIASARTFGYLEDVKRLHANGFGLGGNLENSVIVGDGKVLNPQGLRYSDEFVRHKVLDAIGDLYLAGGQVIGKFHGCRAGHQMTHQLLTELFSQSQNYRWVEGECLDTAPLLSDAAA